MRRKFFAVFAVLMILLSASGACYDYRADDAELLAYIDALCEERGLAPELICAVIERESSWQADACNAAGNCIGLMQIATVNLGWLGESLGVEDLYDPYQNVLAGISMLASYMEAYGDLHRALMCYNCGSGGAQKLFDQGIYESAYSRWVVERMEALQAGAALAAPQLGRDPDPDAEDEVTPEADAAGGEARGKVWIDAAARMEAFGQESNTPDPDAPDGRILPELPEGTEAENAQNSGVDRALRPDGAFTVIYARANDREDPPPPLCAAASAK